MCTHSCMSSFPEAQASDSTVTLPGSEARRSTAELAVEAGPRKALYECRAVRE